MVMWINFRAGVGGKRLLGQLVKANVDLLACGQSCKTAPVITEPFIGVFVSESWSDSFSPHHLPFLLALGRDYLSMKMSIFPPFFSLSSPPPLFFIPSSFPLPVKGCEEGRAGGVGSRRSPPGGIRRCQAGAASTLSTPSSIQTNKPQLFCPWEGLRGPRSVGCCCPIPPQSFPAAGKSLWKDFALLPGEGASPNRYPVP